MLVLKALFIISPNSHYFYCFANIGAAKTPLLAIQPKVVSNLKQGLLALVLLTHSVVNKSFS
jgi:hypothetical protein